MGGRREAKSRDTRRLAAQASEPHTGRHVCQGASSDPLRPPIKRQRGDSLRDSSCGFPVARKRREPLFRVVQFEGETAPYRCRGIRSVLGVNATWRRSSGLEPVEPRDPVVSHIRVAVASSDRSASRSDHIFAENTGGSGQPSLVGVALLSNASVIGLVSSKGEESGGRGAIASVLRLFNMQHGILE